MMPTRKEAKEHFDYKSRRKHPAEYVAWFQMKQRCNNPKARNYKWYGGKGVKVCQRWLSFENFFEDMGTKPSAKHSIDRIDVNGNYEPSNCRWSAMEVQQNNRTDNIRIEHNGENLTLSEWSKKLGIPKTTISDRFKKGWSAKDILTKHQSKYDRLRKTGREN